MTDYARLAQDRDDPLACPACGGIAGVCNSYPNCPGGGERLAIRALAADPLRCYIDPSEILRDDPGYLQSIIKRMLDVWEETCKNDDAAAGYKHREQVMNAARRILKLPTVEIPKNWRE